MTSSISNGARMIELLEGVYGPVIAAELFPRIAALIALYKKKITPSESGWSERDALLITYGDSIVDGQPPLQVLHNFLSQKVGEIISFVHLLPFYPYSSDDGFAVEDFRAVRDDLGNWDDVIKMSADYRLVFDGVINHVSSSSIYMKGYTAGDPQYADFFIALAPDTDTSKVLRTRNLPLLHNYETVDGIKWLWTTFSRDQPDLNFSNPNVLIEILDVLLGYAQKGAAMIRLDAIPYMWKELGTSCAHLPQTHDLIKLMHEVFVAAAPHVILLTETNCPHLENVEYFGNRGDEAQMIYNFTLAPLIVWSLHTGDATVLTEWASGVEKISDNATFLNITATHDGIGMRPTEGILSEEARVKMVQMSIDHGGDVTGKRNSDGSISPYEINLNYFDAINDPRSDEPIETAFKRFIVSQAIPMAMIGIPGIYIHSLLGSRNYYDGVKETGRARTINREQLNIVTLAAELANPASLKSKVFNEMKRLLKIRAQQSAFHPNALQRILDLGPELFAIDRYNETTGQRITALHNITNTRITVEVEEIDGATDVLTGRVVESSPIVLEPYQVCWLAE
ncbi:MAG: sugar phosphorylase [bacterium]